MRESESGDVAVLDAPVEDEESQTEPSERFASARMRAAAHPDNYTRRSERMRAAAMAEGYAWRQRCRDSDAQKENYMPKGL